MIVTTWNIVPDYDEWGSDSSWTCDNWMQWHNELKKKFGVEKAKLIWEYAYAEGSAFSSHWDCRSFNAKFRAYVNTEKLDPYAKLGAISLIVKPIGVGTDVATGVFDFVSSVGRNTKTILTLGLVGLAGFFIYKAYKSV
jgi:hypothetical protein